MKNWVLSQLSKAVLSQLSKATLLVRLDYQRVQRIINQCCMQTPACDRSSVYWWWCSSNLWLPPAQIHASEAFLVDTFSSSTKGLPDYESLIGTVR
jgi:hypothetical protein